jgi:hypothetical protein
MDAGPIVPRGGHYVPVLSSVEPPEAGWLAPPLHFVLAATSDTLSRWRCSAPRADAASRPLRTLEHCPHIHFVVWVLAEMQMAEGWKSVGWTERRSQACRGASAVIRRLAQGFDVRF